MRLVGGSRLIQAQRHYGVRGQKQTNQFNLDDSDGKSELLVLMSVDRSDCAPRRRRLFSCTRSFRYFQELLVRLSGEFVVLVLAGEDALVFLFGELFILVLEREVVLVKASFRW